MIDQKRRAYEFLTDLNENLNSSLPGPVAIGSLIPKVLAEWKTRPKAPMGFPENAFLYHFALPQIFEQMQTVDGIGPDEARQSVLCEYYACVPHLASGNAFRRHGYPFNKKIGLTAAEIMEVWSKPSGSLPANQAYPDLAFRSPFPYKIVFDAKYFAKAGQDAANRALVEGAHEASFYRGLPRTRATEPGKPDWDYEFGCLLAYDASGRSHLRSAWEAVKTKRLFWEGGNVFIMIVRGHDT